jgi:hypothetical protein
MLVTMFLWLPTMFSPWVERVTWVSSVLVAALLFAGALVIRAVRRVLAGRWDLVVDHSRGLVTIPRSSGLPLDVQVDRIEWVEARLGPPPKKGRSSWIVDLGANSGTPRWEGIARFGSQCDAMAFAAWLRQQLEIQRA